jgi:hypothetical protein
MSGYEWPWPVKTYRYSLCICEKAAENGIFPPHPKHVSLAALNSFRLLRQAWTVLRLRSACWFLTFFPPSPPTQKSPLTGVLFWVVDLTPEMDFSRSLAGHGSQYIWDFVPFAYRPRFHTHPPSLSLGVYFLSSRTWAFNYECNIVAIPHSLLSSVLDSSRKPRRHVGRTGEILKD